jgi:hypothetical protein
LAKNCRPKNDSGWLSVLVWLGLVSCLLLPAIALAQTDAAPHPSADKKSGSIHPSRTSSKSHPSSTHRKTNSVASSRSTKGRRSRSRRVARGQQKIDPQRAEEIQDALIRDHYLTGEPTGKWDQASEDALRRYQSDHGWQSKTVPDSRALISLGLGPSHDHLLNPESAMTTGPDVSHSVDSSPPAPVSHGPQTAPVSTSPAPVGDPPNSAQHDPSNQQQ